MEYTCEIITTVLVGLFGLLEANAFRRNKKTEARAKLRAEENKLSMKMQNAALNLSIVTAIAVAGGHINSNMEVAQKKAREAAAEYEDFIRGVAAKQITKV